MGVQTLDSQVREILRDYPHTRDNDIDLWIKILEVFYSDYVSNGSVELRKLHDLPREDHVKRVRAKVQNDEHLYLPTDPAVAEKRGWALDQWRGYILGEQTAQSHERPRPVDQPFVEPAQDALFDIPPVEPVKTNDGRRD